MERPLLPVAVTAALSFAAYATFVQFAPFTVKVVQNQVDTNMMRAQNFLAASPDTVLVGSSLTFRLPTSLLEPQVANIGMVGGSSLTGLAIVDGSGQKPKLVLIESNLLERPLDKDAVQAQLRFPERFLRQHFRVFRTGYDPANLIWRGLTSLTHQTVADIVLTPQAARAFYLEQQQLKAHPPEPVNFQHNLQQTAALVASLEAKGIKVGFFELPINPGLMNSPADTAVRREVRRAFPSGRYCWLDLQIPGGAHTLDGVHLTLEDSAATTRKILAQRKNCF
ncbi:MAG: hypothetical protein H0U98_03435 [Alphaproteobacteria bacterium]|nr:hypothetical protein [Alphaproteobacteria bacterium]